MTRTNLPLLPLALVLLGYGSACSSDDTASGAPSRDASSPMDATATDTGADAAEVADAPDGAFDAHPPPIGADCNPVQQTGCPAGQECTFTSTLACDPAGAAAIGAPCDAGAPADCVSGGECMLASGAASVATCAQFCSKDTDCAASAVASGPIPEPANVAHCLITIGGTNYRLCTVPCNPVGVAGTSGCALGLGCLLASSPTFSEFTACGVTGSGGDGATCATSADCAAGFTCVTSGPLPVSDAGPLDASDDGAASDAASDSGTSDGGAVPDASTSDSGAPPDAGASVCRAVCRAFTDGDCPSSSDVCTIAPGNTNPMFGACCPSGGC